MKKIWLKHKVFFQKNYYFIFSLIVFFSSFLFFQKTLSYENDQFIIASKLWSDFAAHIPMIRSFSLGENLSISNWPPQYPVFAGEKINYHYGFYAVVAGFEKLGLDLAWSTNLLSAIGVTLLLVMILRISESIFKSKKVGLLAIFLFLFNGSLSFVEYFSSNGVSWDSLIRISSQTKFANFGPWNGDVVSAFWNWNIYTNQRHLALGFGLMLLAIRDLWSLRGKKKQKEKSFLHDWDHIILIALLPIFHQAAFFATGVIVFSYWLLDFKNRWGLKKYLKYIAGLILGLIGYLSISSGFDFHWKWGFLATDKSILGVLQYWWFNLGLYLPLLPIVLLKSSKKYRPLLLSGLVMFVLANTVQFSPDMINNHKLVNIFQIILVMGVADLLFKTWKSKQSIFQKISIIVVFVGLTFSGFIDMFPVMNDNIYHQDDYTGSEFGNWVENETDSNSTFLVNVYLYNPASLAGRKTFLDYGYFAWSMGYQDSQRRKVLSDIFSLDISQDEWCEIDSLELIDYFAIDQQGNNLEELKERESDQNPVFYDFSSPVFSSDKYLVYSREEICL